MTESQIGEYTELININLNKIKKQVNRIEPGGGNRERYNTINSILEDIRRTVEIMALGEQYEHDFKTMIKFIDEHQPEEMRLRDEEWKRFDELKKEVMNHRKKK